MNSEPQGDSSDYAVLVGTGGGGSSTPSSGPISSASEEALALLPESTVGNVQVVRLIGCGKVSETWFGVDAVNQRELVLKVLRKPWCVDARIRSYFQQQLMNVAELKHPNLANVLEVGCEDQLLFWTTEWVKGGSVWSKVRRKGPMDIALALNVIDQAAAGLAHGAVAKLVHGGLKPENILMERSGSVKVSDLGIEFAARQLISGTPASTALWTAEFMAPEVRSGAIPDVRSDIFSLGAVLLYLVAGVVPHDGLLDASSPRITPALRDLLIGMTAPKPADRLADYGELRAALADAEAGNTGVRRAQPSNWISDTTHDGNVVPMFAADTVILDVPVEQDGSLAITDSGVEEASGVTVTGVAPKPQYIETTDEAELTESPIPVFPAQLTASTPEKPHIDVSVPAQLRLRTPDQSTTARGKRTHLLVAAIAVVLVAAGGAAYYLAHFQAGDSVAESASVVPVAAVAPIAAVVSAPTEAAAPQAVAPAAVQPKPGDSMVPLSALPLQTLPPGVDPSALAAVPPGATAPLPPGVAPQAVSSVAAPVATPMQQIIIDNATPGALKLDPSNGWRPSTETRASFENSSLVAPAGLPICKATFMADVPRDGRYQLYLWWVARAPELRSEAVPATVYTASGPINITLDQVNTDTDFNLVGTYHLKSGPHQPIITISNEGVANNSGTVHVSVDALKIVPVGQ